MPGWLRERISGNLHGPATSPTPPIGAVMGGLMRWCEQLVGREAPFAVDDDGLFSAVLGDSMDVNVW
jgi:hypothetical protein